MISRRFIILAVWGAVLTSMLLTGCSDSGEDMSSVIAMNIPSADSGLEPIEKPYISDMLLGNSLPETPSFEIPSIEEPSSEKPSSEDPSIEKPSSEEPSSEEPSSEEPSSEEPSSEEPSEEPSQDITGVFDGGSGETLLSGGKVPFVHYSQTDPLYKLIPYGNQTIGSHGCGPTNMAMILSTMTQTVIRPDTLAKWAVKNGYYVKNVGTSHSFMSAIAKQYGVTTTVVRSMDKAVAALKEGKYVLCVVTSGDFSPGAHFLTLRGITKDGKILVADSLSLERSQKEWTVSRIKSNLRSVQFWVFEK